jgi:hypothetical protein
VKIVFTLLLVALAYAGWGAFTELRLINLGRSRDLTRVEPRTVLENHQERSFINSTVEKIYQEEGDRNKMFPWVRYLKEWEAVAILAAACGFAGGFMRLFMDSQTGIELHNNSPFIGLGLALIITAILAVGDTLMREGELHFKPASVVAMCLLVGIAWEHAWQFIKKKATAASPA